MLYYFPVVLLAEHAYTKNSYGRTTRKGGGRYKGKRRYRVLAKFWAYGGHHISALAVLTVHLAVFFTGRFRGHRPLIK